ncbi:MAG: hypothetical protein JWM22_995, partial [Frankiales bacterium]|nr:hypothetical protein [Frankiales bacterium]
MLAPSAIPAKRYAPFVAVILAQLVLVAVAPSKGRVENAPTFAGSSTQADGQVPGQGASTLPGGSGGATTGTSGAVPGGTSGGTGGGTTGAPGVGSRQVPAGADTSRCHGAKQFTDFPQAPRCVAHTGNPGATYPGVTGKTINLVYFREKDNPVVKGLLQSIGLYSDPKDQQAFISAMEDFINSRYELYGRKVKMSFWQS